MTPYNVAHARLGSSRLSAVPFEFVVAAVPGRYRYRGDGPSFTFTCLLLMFLAVVV